MPVTVCGEAARRQARFEPHGHGKENAADTAEASNSLRMAIPFQRLKIMFDD